VPFQPIEPVGDPPPTISRIDHSEGDAWRLWHSLESMLDSNHP
jgi:hypothetical protein